MLPRTQLTPTVTASKLSRRISSSPQLKAKQKFDNWKHVPEIVETLTYEAGVGPNMLDLETFQETLVAAKKTHNISLGSARSASAADLKRTASKGQGLRSSASSAVATLARIDPIFKVNTVQKVLSNRMLY